MRSLTTHFSKALVVMSAVLSIGAVSANRAAGDELIVATFGDNTVLNYDSASGAFRGKFATLPANAGLSHPTFGPDGNLYVEGENSHAIYKLDGKTGAKLADFVPANSGILPLPFGIRFRNGIAYIGNFASDAAFTHGNILKFDATTGAFLGLFADVAGWVGGFDFGADGNVYVALRNTNRVDVYNGTTGAFIKTLIPKVFDETPGSFFTGCSMLEFGPDGNLYISRFSGLAGLGVVMKRYTPAGAFIGNVITDSYFETNLANQFAFAPGGIIDILDSTTGAIRQYDRVTGAFLRTLASNIAGGRRESLTDRWSRQTTFSSQRSSTMWC